MTATAARIVYSPLAWGGCGGGNYESDECLSSPAISDGGKGG